MDFASLTTPDDRVAVIATQPLTDDEEWTEMKPGELLLFSRGRPWGSSAEIANYGLTPDGTELGSIHSARRLASKA